MIIVAIIIIVIWKMKITIITIRRKIIIVITRTIKSNDNSIWKYSDDNSNISSNRYFNANNSMSNDKNIDNGNDLK